VFEKLYRTDVITDANLVASHEDLNDEGQTVSVPTDLLDNHVPDKSTGKENPQTSTPTGSRPKTGDSGVMRYIILLAAAAGGMTTVLVKRRKSLRKA